MASCFYARIISFPLFLKCINADKKVNAVVLQIVTARYEISVKPVSPVNLGEHVFIWIEN